MAIWGPAPRPDHRETTNPRGEPGAPDVEETAAPGAVKRLGVMGIYAVSGVWIDSDVAFELLMPADSDAPPGAVVRFRLAAESVEPDGPWLLSRTLEDEPEPWLSVGRLDGAYLLRMHGQADFVLDTDAREILCRPTASCSQPQLEHLLADQILPHWLHLLGQPTFHASAVLRTDGRVVAFLGPSRSGKSTLAASLGAPNRVVCDDTLAVCLDTPEVTVFPSYPAVRLWADSADALFRDGATHEHARPLKVKKPMRATTGELRLSALYVLQPMQDSPRVEPLSRRDGVVELAKYLDRLDPSDQERLTRELDHLVDLVQRVRVARLCVPHRYEQLPAIHAALEADLSRSAR